MQLQEYEHKLSRLQETLKSYDANKADSDYRELAKMFETVYQSGVLAIIHLPKQQQDGLKLPLFTALAAQSGSLAFLVVQILAAHNIMGKNGFTKQPYPASRCGIAINHLRLRETAVSAKRARGGYALTGTLRWASGYRIFDTLLIGFHCEGQEMEALAPFAAADGFAVGQADATFVGYGLNTVDIELSDFFVPSENVVSANPIGNYTRNKSASKTVHFCLYGLGEAALEHVHDREFEKAAMQKLQVIQKRFVDSSNIDELDKLRVELFGLSQQIITTAMTLKGGASVLADEPLQRLYRELIMFNANGLNPRLKELFKDKFVTLED